jgi:hypothetical protein
MKITEQIRAAVEAAIKQLGSQSELSRCSGIPRSSICKYLMPKSSHIRSDSWIKLKPFLGAEYGLSKQSAISRSLGLNIDESILIDSYRKMKAEDKKELLRVAIQKS